MDTFIAKSRQEQLVEARFGADIRVVLRDLYDSGLSQAAVADRVGVGRATVVEWMKKYGIPTRDRRAVRDAVA